MSALLAARIVVRESERIVCVDQFPIPQTTPYGAFDRIAAMAARRFDAPISLISVVDTEQIWVKSQPGVPNGQLGPYSGARASAILGRHPLMLPGVVVDSGDLMSSVIDPLFSGIFNPRFYVAVPLCTSDGHTRGTLCVIDREPRTASREQVDDLNNLAAIAVDQLEMHLSARHAQAQAQLMTREVDHRIMNSLQCIAASLVMQSRRADVTDAAAQLKVSADRILAVARVHRNVYSQPCATVCCAEFLRRLCADLSTIVSRPIDVDSDPGNVLARLIQPLGLLVNELVTNAAKHGAGRITVIHRARGKSHELLVCDDGPGLPPDFDPRASKSGFGMKVILALVDQLGGTLSCVSVVTGGGACFKVTFSGL